MRTLATSRVSDQCQIAESGAASDGAQNIGRGDRMWVYGVSRIGMDLHELGGAAYPEFVVHRDESYR